MFDARKRTREVDAEAIDGFQAEGVVLGGVVVVFDPVSELAVENVEEVEIELANEELIADAAEEVVDALGGTTAVCRRTQPTRAQMR